MDSSFDWEIEVAELRQCIVNKERDGFEQKLLKSWESARDDMDKDAALLHNEVLEMHHPVSLLRIYHVNVGTGIVLCL